MQIKLIVVVVVVETIGARDPFLERPDYCNDPLKLLFLLPLR